MKIKILEVHQKDYYDDDYYGNGFVLDKQTIWEEVDQEQYEALCSWAGDQNKLKYTTKNKIIIVKELDVNIPKTIKEYIEQARLYKIEQDKKIEKQKIKEEKRKNTIKLKKEERERKQLEKLKEKYG